MSDNLSFGQFLEKYPDDAVCLEEIVNLKYPNGIRCKNCRAITKHYRLKSRSAYSCKVCRSQTFPLVGTIFERSSTPLNYWFYAIFLMVKTRSGISAKQLQRELGVSYNTAWRMFKQIRILMNSNPKDLLTGTVEVDETWIGGKGWFRGKTWWKDWKDRPKEIVLGMVERGGRVRTAIIEDTSRHILTKQIKANIDPQTWVITDNHQGYWYLNRHGFKHDSVNHGLHYVDSINKEVHTQTIEGFWGQAKRGITGVYRHVSKKYLPLYLGEYTFRYNHRKNPEEMFGILLRQVKQG